MQISLDTRDVFIECTATDLTKAKIVLNTVCAMFSEYCEQPYVVEPVEVIDSFGESQGECTGSNSQDQYVQYLVVAHVIYVYEYIT